MTIEELKAENERLRATLAEFGAPPDQFRATHATMLANIEKVERRIVALETEVSEGDAKLDKIWLLCQEHGMDISDQNDDRLALDQMLDFIRNKCIEMKNDKSALADAFNFVKATKAENERLREQVAELSSAENRRTDVVADLRSQLAAAQTRIAELEGACRKAQYILLRETEIERIMRARPNTMTAEALEAVNAALAPPTAKGGEQ